MNKDFSERDQQINDYLTHKMTDEERAAFESQLSIDKELREAVALEKEMLRFFQQSKKHETERARFVIQQIEAETAPAIPVSFKRKKWLWAGLFVAVCSVVGFSYYFTRDETNPAPNILPPNMADKDSLRSLDTGLYHNKVENETLVHFPTPNIAKQAVKPSQFSDSLATYTVLLNETRTQQAELMTLLRQNIALNQIVQDTLAALLKCKEEKGTGSGIGAVKEPKMITDSVILAQISQYKFPTAPQNMQQLKTQKATITKWKHENEIRIAEALHRQMDLTRWKGIYKEKLIKCRK